MATQAVTEGDRRTRALDDYRKKLKEHRELDAKLKKSEYRNVISFSSHPDSLPHFVLVFSAFAPPSLPQCEKS